MWVFGYGSLMADEWEERYACVRRTIATLRGFRRTFTKASTKNWGSKEVPCPTLNLEKVENAECWGVAFHFPDPAIWLFAHILLNERVQRFRLRK